MRLGCRCHAILNLGMGLVKLGMHHRNRFVPLFGCDGRKCYRYPTSIRSNAPRGRILHRKHAIEMPQAAVSHTAGTTP